MTRKNSIVSRLRGALRNAVRAQLEPWERLREIDPDPWDELRWIRTSRGWRLTGSRLADHI